MKMKVQVIIEYEGNETPVVEEVACLQRGELLPASVGLTLNEGKEMLSKIQENMVIYQVEEYIAQRRHCPNCRVEYSCKGTHGLTFRTLFGKMELPSPRFYSCSCHSQTKKSFSPLAERLPERTAPELLYLQTKWASLMSYGLTVDLLEEVLPLHASIASTLRNTHKIAKKIESELGDEQFVFIEGCERDWEGLPTPDEPLTVGIDGGYVHARNGDNRKAGWFEVIVGKSMKGQGDCRRFGFVNGYDKKPKRRLFDMLKSQGLQMNQAITFLSDGGDVVRNLQLYMSPQAEHLLDWFHVTMRLTVMKQMAKGLSNQFPDLENDLERVKWYLWHGNVFRTLQVLDDIQFDIEGFDADKNISKLQKAVQEFNGYISANRAFIPNYGDRYHYGETITTAFVESTVNEVVSRRMVKKQQMRWTKKGAHLLLQVRTQTLNDDLRDTFNRWYPGMTHTETTAATANSSSTQCYVC